MKPRWYNSIDSCFILQPGVQLTLEFKELKSKWGSFALGGKNAWFFFPLFVGISGIKQFKSFNCWNVYW